MVDRTPCTAGSPASIPNPHLCIDIQAFSNASSTVGIGICIQGQWWAWMLQPNWNADGHNIRWAEAVGFKLLAHTLLLLTQPHTTLLVHGDNQGVIEAWQHGHSRNKHVNRIFKCLIPDLLHGNCHIVTVKYIPSRGNPADPISRGNFPSHTLLLPTCPIPSNLTPFLHDPLKGPATAPIHHI